MHQSTSQEYFFMNFLTRFKKSTKMTDQKLGLVVRCSYYQHEYQRSSSDEDFTGIDLQQLLFHSVVETTPSYLSETSTLVRASKLGSTQLLPNRCTYPPSFFGSCSIVLPTKIKGVPFELLHYTAAHTTQTDGRGIGTQVVNTNHLLF